MTEWPDWHPPAEMIERQPYLPRFMAGGESNPLGARALYLGKTIYRIHGTNQPSTIGKFVSSGCIRMLNEDAEDLYLAGQGGYSRRGYREARRSPLPAPCRITRWYRASPCLARGAPGLHAWTDRDKSAKLLYEEGSGRGLVMAAPCQFLNEATASAFCLTLSTSEELRAAPHPGGLDWIPDCRNAPRSAALDTRDRRHLFPGGDGGPLCLAPHHARADHRERRSPRRDRGHADCAHRRAAWPSPEPGRAGALRELAMIAKYSPVVSPEPASRSRIPQISRGRARGPTSQPARDHRRSFTRVVA